MDTLKIITELTAAEAEFHKENGLDKYEEKDRQRCIHGFKQKTSREAVLQAMRRMGVSNV